MPFTALPAMLGRAPLCAQCARAARRATTATSFSTTTSRSFSQLTTTTRRTTVPARSLSLQQTRLFSLSSRLSTPARSQPASSSSSETSSPSAGTSDAPQGPPSFYALFPKTFPLGGPPVGPFHVDIRALRTEFLQLQAAAHPDFHHSAGASSDASTSDSGAGHSSARARAEALSSLINEAYRTLASPLLRAQYLLRQRFDVDLANDESTLSGGSGKDMELLMAVLEVREEIEGAKSEEDLDPVREANNTRMKASEEVLSDAFRADDAAVAQREAVRLRYWVNIDDALRNWERGKDIVLEH
ncbi:hypothetical protein Sste5346_008808 [Sporothrix stenoceras]|uniref:Co-chaperone HscB C-terminal oligomerisation domain-containing protein n=1 Tax=Sporothrix stenoceras TaxID=5173 RepID=A0ABR3YNQ3_9PEZI